RKPKEEKHGGMTGYSGERDPNCKVHFGTCAVTSPKSHVLGALRGLGADPPEPESEPRFWEGLASELADGEKTVLVFIHGYNTAFDAAVKRTAQIGRDLKFSGVLAIFSWPSQSRSGLRNYLADGEAAEASASPLKDFLTKLTAKSGPGRVNLLAHSM